MESRGARICKQTVFSPARPARRGTSVSLGAGLAALEQLATGRVDDWRRAVQPNVPRRLIKRMGGLGHRQLVVHFNVTRGQFGHVPYDGLVGLATS